MLRTLFAVFGAVFVPICAFAAAFGPTEQLHKGEVLRGRFVQEHYMEGIEKPLKSEGHFVIAPPYGVIWAIEKPMPLTVTATKEGSLQRIGNVMLMRQSTEKFPYIGHITDMLGKALGGNLEALSVDFVMKKDGNPKQWRVKLTPRTQAKKGFPFQSITAKGSRFVEEAVLIRPSGFSDVFVFSNQAITSDPPSESEKMLFAAVARAK